MFIEYLHMRPDLVATPGLIRYAFLVQNPWCCYTLSIWETESALAQFANVPSHLRSLRHSKRWCSEIWSSYWRLDAVSGTASQWPGLVTWPSLMWTKYHHGSRLVQSADWSVGT